MCVTFLYLDDKMIDNPEGYQLILLNNRDEFFDRPTTLAAWQDNILCGLDRKNDYGGTWLGIDKSGRIGNILAVLENETDKTSRAPSRGKIVREYIKSNLSPEDYFMQQLSDEAQQYCGFNLFLLDRQHNKSTGQKSYSGIYFSNRDNSSAVNFGTGIYGFGNSASYQKPFKKVTYGLELFKETLAMLHDEKFSDQELINRLLDILTDQTSHHPDEQLISQKRQNEQYCKLMSQLFYELPDSVRYGTRSHTIVLIDGAGRCTYFERSRSQQTPSSDVTWTDTTHCFDLENL
ncbi:unnamed protein product [Thelazia callipaeda]|uniref:NRDE family protein n=1 Tax=Thelazia callipaeda TaxID=103827 RepID=A0A0N5D4H9_THECL|nr:unnamed protein product [Thelazia callipaeda]